MTHINYNIETKDEFKIGNQLFICLDLCFKKKVEGIKNVSLAAKKFLFTCAQNTPASKGVQFYKGKLISYLLNAQTMMYSKTEQYKRLWGCFR